MTVKFKGWDWTELLALWGKEMKDFGDDEDKAAEFLVDAVLMCYDPWDGARPRLRDVRRFARKCAKASHHTSQPILQAIATVKCDHAFVEWFSSTLTWWWT